MWIFFSVDNYLLLMVNIDKTQKTQSALQHKPVFTQARTHSYTGGRECNTRCYMLIRKMITIHTNTHTAIRSNLGVSVLPRDTSTPNHLPFWLMDDYFTSGVTAT